MIRVTVDVAAIRAGEPGIIVEYNGRRFQARDVRLHGTVRVVQGGPLRDGATAWVEAEHYTVLVP